MERGDPGVTTTEITITTAGTTGITGAIAECTLTTRGVGTIVTITSVEDTTTTGAPTTIEAVGG